MNFADPTTLMLASLFGVSLLGVLYLLFTGDSDAVDERLSDLGKDQPEGTKITAQGANMKAVRKAWSQKEERRHKLGDRLVQAGLYKRNSSALFYASQVALCVTPVLIGFGMATMGLTTMRTGLLLGVMTGIGGVIAPGFWLEAQKRGRQTAIRRALPDALDLLIICVEAGMSLPSALVRVTKELRTAHPMLAMELIIVHREIQLGHSTGEALRRFADRFDLEELRSLSSVIRQAERFGASIVNAIRVHADTLRHKRMEQARERAQKASVKLLFPTVLCIFPAIFVVMLGPAAFRILEMFRTVQTPNL